jgi:hypothetical protein
VAKFICNPIEVDAFAITEVSPQDADGNFIITLDDGSQKEMRPNSGMTSRMYPAIGDYLVKTHQPDEYEYLNPKHVFEAKYTKIKD